MRVYVIKKKEETAIAELWEYSAEAGFICHSYRDAWAIPEEDLSAVQVVREHFPPGLKQFEGKVEGVEEIWIG